MTHNLTYTDNGTSTRAAVSHWWEESACKGVDVDLFMPPTSRSVAANLEQIEDARSYCDRCPVKRDCLIDAIVTGDQWSMRGGLTAEERGWRTDGRNTSDHPRLGVCSHPSCDRIFEFDKGRGTASAQYCSDACRKTARHVQKMASQHRKRTP